VIISFGTSRDIDHGSTREFIGAAEIVYTLLRTP
jgi:hypothetical protein